MSKKRERKHPVPNIRKVDRDIPARFLMQRDMVFAAVRNNDYCYAPVNPAYDDPQATVGKLYKYRIVKRYQYHMLCEHIPSGLKKSFTYADVLTGWCKCKKQ
jgi:hypothetical protein